MKIFISAVVVIVVVVIGGYLFTQSSFYKKSETPQMPNTNPTMVDITATTTSEVKEEEKDKTKTVIGKSVEGRDIVAYHYGEGDTDLLFIGGIHGGYSWNTALVSYELMDYLAQSSSTVPKNVRVTVIPVMNPDGLSKVVGSTTGRFAQADISGSQETLIKGRFNANVVDLNRNFDCDWNEKGMWQNKAVSGGAAVFSEPESQAVKAYVEANTPDAVVVWYSSAGGVFASSCHNGVSGETTSIMKTFADASGYKAYQDFDFYEITGDMVNWFAKKEIPAISVLLATHTSTDWAKNKAGVDALLKFYAK
ncbi:hypothetical protein K2X96_01230 [Patescibacteria group bacterium]|nr:hypothetical protein [Patescibacteria group bacterium]